MTAIAMHATPRLRDVVREQISAVGIRIRAVGVLLFCTMMIYAVVIIGVVRNELQSQAHLANARPTTFEFIPEISVIITYLALLLPAMIWHEENPTQRTYHLAMPVERSTHALVKTLAGLAWLLLYTAMFVAVIVGVDMITRSMRGMPLAFSAHVQWWGWLVPFTSVTIAYLFSSAAGVGAKTPAVWVVGPPVIYVALSYVAAMLGYPSTAKSMLTLFSGRFGAAAAIGGRVAQPDDWGRTLGMPNGWFWATIIWGAVALVLLYFVSRRRSSLT